MAFARHAQNLAGVSRHHTPAGSLLDPDVGEEELASPFFAGNQRLALEDAVLNDEPLINAKLPLFIVTGRPRSDIISSVGYIFDLRAVKNSEGIEIKSLESSFRMISPKNNQPPELKADRPRKSVEIEGEFEVAASIHRSPIFDGRVETNLLRRLNCLSG